MRTSLFSSLLFPLLVAATTTTTSITLHIPPSNVLPNPRTLPPSTHATLTSLGVDASAYLTPSNTFVFHNVSQGSYLLDVHCPSHGFAPLRVDVLPVVSGEGQTQKEERVAGLKVSAWETYRGNDWDNKGEAVVVMGGSLGVRVMGQKAFYMERSTFNILSILKNPMILLGLVSMAIFIGMPKLVDNMDPEMRKEWEESQKSNPMNSLMGGGGGGQNPVANFDMASFLAGSSSSKDNNNDGGSSSKKEKGGRK
ncbi:hypothetical protein M406DRAFT_351175 [Cryphonectria parasitica EP155]|uniref:ER membrane protein complex subunit 7 beta-sandwich domain-containing protein n=1 Tax=Cryphonectria parasitica (strain ATCC 38755 / EP155) TaxID=660469 RepID=A0A9P5CP57_CRYP1|nr:uncharacterized protein M406DRAFT_351175 [Cryphonectria parasitica EP155]KAF3765828.1 hypothetical protein M406DRAFT_351175 [Cryphonectria parasitica EP155]